MTKQLQLLIETIETAFERRNELSPINCPENTKLAIESALHGLNTGEYRVAEKTDHQWHVHQWLKKAVLLSFKVNSNAVINPHSTLQSFDKVNVKYADYSRADFEQDAIRVVPGAIVRSSSFIANNVILMPSFVNVGAYIDAGCMIDTWATIGSCAQIGRNCHISGGAGIGGVLEPLQANPTIIEDNCFIGARSEIVEGVIIGKNSVISMGVYIGQSTKIYNRLTGEITYGTVPEGSVIVPGNLPSDDGKYSLYCAVIIKQVDEKTRAKTSINDLLR